MTEATASQTQPHFNIEKLYVKDLSVEVPHAPEIFLEREAPRIDLQLNTQHSPVSEGVFDVTVTAIVTAKVKDRVLFLIEAKQAGIFSVRNVPQQEMETVLEVVCPNILYPYLRELVSDSSVRDEMLERAHEALAAAKMKRYWPIACLSALLAWAGSAAALDYGSITGQSAILYDAPSAKARKLYVVSRYTPLELVVTLDAWVKVRTQDGSLAWAEKRNLGNARYVVVTAVLANVRKSPDPAAALVFQARKQVALEWLENTGTGWIKVKHPDGATGYVRVNEVWGD